MKRLRPFAPVPLRFLEEVLPDLRDTELRVILAVLARTVSRKDPINGRPLDEGWMSHSFLKAHTGRASEAVSAAVEALVRRGLLVVQDARGTAPVEPRERRAVQGKLFYGPGPNLKAMLWADDETSGKAKTRTREREDFPVRFRIAGDTRLTEEQRRRIAREKENIRARFRKGE